jgi:outer membrane protein assembly factor BamB
MCINWRVVSEEWRVVSGVAVFLSTHHSPLFTKGGVMTRRQVVLTLVVFVLATAGARAEEWPGWRGPRGDGSSQETGIPTRWSPTENVHWKVEIPGTGHSSPVVWGDHIFVTTCLEKEKDRVLLCLDRATGKKRWERTVLTSPLEKKHSLNSFASATPATDGQHVWVAFLQEGNMQVVCYDNEGKKLWQRSPGKLLSVHGFCSSPVLHNGMVILNGDQDALAYIVALDQKTGEERWRANRPNKTRSYCTPLLIPDPRHKGHTQLVLSGSKSVTGYDADTGKLLWVHDGPTEQYVASLVEDSGILFLTTGFPEHHLMGITPDGEGNITSSKHVVWHIGNKENRDRGASYVPSPVAHQGYFYVVSDPGYLSCLEAKTGKRVYMQKLGRRHSASPVLIEDRLYLPDDDGVTWVVKTGPKFELVEKNDLKDGIFASPAVSRKEMLLRTTHHLYCISSPERAAAGR